MYRAHLCLTTWEVAGLTVLFNPVTSSCGFESHKKPQYTWWFETEVAPWAAFEKISNPGWHEARRRGQRERLEGVAGTEPVNFVTTRRLQSVLLPYPPPIIHGARHGKVWN
jgi:hypothetical protein